MKIIFHLLIIILLILKITCINYELTDGEAYVSVTIDGQEYVGCAFTMTDEAGNNTLCISAKGDNNETVWAVKYLQ